MKKWMFNPFIYLAGVRSLIIGGVILILTAVIGYYSLTHFDGILDTHQSHARTLFLIHVSELLIDWMCATMVFYAAGLFFSRSAIRWIDVAGTVSFARWPMLLSALVGFGIKLPADLKHLPIGEIKNYITGNIIILSLVSVLLTVWMVALLYNAFSVSCNLKGGKAAGIFIGSIIIAEILSKIAFYFIY